MQKIDGVEYVTAIPMTEEEYRFYALLSLAKDYPKPSTEGYYITPPSGVPYWLPADAFWKYFEHVEGNEYLNLQSVKEYFESIHKGLSNLLGQ